MKPVNNLLGRQFGRLIVLERAPNPETRKNDTAAYWKCLCSCGNTRIIRGYSLTTNKTQSCGCLKLEAPHLIPFSVPKLDPLVAAAKLVWRMRYKELPLDTYIQLAQMPCYYCGDPPSMRKLSRRKEATTFVFNTLDRIDSSLGHTIDNVVPACMVCNRAKLQRSVDEFNQHVVRLIDNLDRISPEEYRKLTQSVDISVFSDENKYALITSIKGAKGQYKDGNITLEQFYQLAVSDCYYCSMPPSNKRHMITKQSSQYAKDTASFIYNGLDRIDNNGSHDYDNVVPCCKWCNSAKEQLTIDQFNDWIRRLATKHQNKLP